MTWQEVIKNDSIADKVLKNLVRIFYEKVNMADKIKRIVIDKENGVITLVVFPKMANMMIGRQGMLLNELEKRLKRWKVRFEE